MRLLTWNVLWRFDPDWRVRHVAILARLRELAPDVVALQECWADSVTSQASVLGRELGMHGVYLASTSPGAPDAVDPDEQDSVTMGVGLLSRWPLTDLRRHELPVTHGQIPPVAAVARVAHPRHPFEVIVAATEWESRFADDHHAQTAQLAGMLTERSLLPRVLLADLNCDPTQPAFAPFLRPELIDSWDAGGGPPDAVTLSSETGCAPQDAVGQLDRRVDHILFRSVDAVVVERAFIVSAPVDGREPSDHFPVVVDAHFPSPMPGRPHGRPAARTA